MIKSMPGQEAIESSVDPGRIRSPWVMAKTLRLAITARQRGYRAVSFPSSRQPTWDSVISTPSPQSADAPLYSAVRRATPLTLAKVVVSSLVMRAESPTRMVPSLASNRLALSAGPIRSPLVQVTTKSLVGPTRIRSLLALETTLRSATTDKQIGLPMVIYPKSSQPMLPLAIAIPSRQSEDTPLFSVEQQETSLTSGKETAS